jgi:rubrerythrin
VSQYVEGESLADMIREDLIAERIVIDVYRKMIKFFGDKDPTTRVMIEGILEDEEDHASDLTDLLYVVNPSTGETEVQDPGTEIGENDREARMDHVPTLNSSQSRREESERAYREERAAARANARKDAEQAREAIGNIEDRQGRKRPQPTNVRQLQGNRGNGKIEQRRGAQSEDGNRGGRRDTRSREPERITAVKPSKSAKQIRRKRAA